MLLIVRGASAVTYDDVDQGELISSISVLCTCRDPVNVSLFVYLAIFSAAINRESDDVNEDINVTTDQPRLCQVRVAPGTSQITRTLTMIVGKKSTLEPSKRVTQSSHIMSSPRSEYQGSDNTHETDANTPSETKRTRTDDPMNLCTPHHSLAKQSLENKK